jgi:cell division protein FtsL
MARAATAAAPARQAPTRRAAAAPVRKGSARRAAAAPARKASPRRATGSRSAPATRPARGRAAPARRRSPARGRATVRLPALTQLTKTALRARGQAALDGLLHGPALIGLVFVLLVGIVFSNVALLQKSRQITHDAARVSELKRDNATLRKDVAELGSSERIQQVAAERGLVLPAPDAVRYLRSNPPLDARNAAKRLDEDTAVAAAPAYTDPTAIAGTPEAIDGATADVP